LSADRIIFNITTPHSGRMEWLLHILISILVRERVLKFERLLGNGGFPVAVIWKVLGCRFGCGEFLIAGMWRVADCRDVEGC
jgi:hypothetical protein